MQHVHRKYRQMPLHDILLTHPDKTSLYVKQAYLTCTRRRRPFGKGDSLMDFSLQNTP